MIKLKSLLSENTLIEAFKDVNGVVWPHFKDQKSVTTFTNMLNTANTPINNDVKGVLFENDRTDSIMATRLGTNSIMQFCWAFWGCNALNPNWLQPQLPRDMSAVTRNVFTISSMEQLQKYNSKTSVQQLISPNIIYTAISQPDNIKWWNTSIEYPKGTQITRWNLFLDTYLRPNYDKVKSLYVAAAPKPATPGMQPGTAKAPVKP
jgi:hypothetical protein